MKCRNLFSLQCGKEISRNENMKVRVPYKDYKIELKQMKVRVLKSGLGQILLKVKIMFCASIGPSVGATQRRRPL